MKQLLLIFILLFFVSYTPLKAQYGKYIPDSSYFVMQVDLEKISSSVPVNKLAEYDAVKAIFKGLKSPHDSTHTLVSSGIDFKKSLFAGQKVTEGYTLETYILPVKKLSKFKKVFDAEEGTHISFTDDFYYKQEVTHLSKDKYIVTQIKWGYNHFRNCTEQLYDKMDWEVPNQYNRYYYNNSIEKAYSKEEIEKRDSILDVNLKTFERRVDSVKSALTKQWITDYKAFLENPKKSMVNDKKFKQLISKDADAFTYSNFNYSPTVIQRNGFGFDKDKFGSIFIDFMEGLQQYNVFTISSDGITVDATITGSDAYQEFTMGSINNKFDSGLFAYIPSDVKGFGVLNTTLSGAYHKLKEYYLPKWENSDDGYQLLAIAILHTIEEIMNVDNVLNSLAPNTLVTYNGLKKVTLEETYFEYNDETFESIEKVRIREEKVPTGSLIISNENVYLVKEYLRAIAKIQDDSSLVAYDNYYGFIGMAGMPLYIGTNNNYLIITNDKDMIDNHIEGYKNNASDNPFVAKAKTAQLAYGYFDFSSLTADFATLGLIDEASEFFQKTNGKATNIEFEVTEVSKKQTKATLIMDTPDEFENGLFYLLDLTQQLTKGK